LRGFFGLAKCLLVATSLKKKTETLKAEILDIGFLARGLSRYFFWIKVACNATVSQAPFRFT